MSAEKPLMSFEQLSSAAASLNRATNELTATVDALDRALLGLNIGLAAWVRVVQWADEDGGYEVEQVGYSKIQGDWCIGIRRLVGHSNAIGPDEVRDVWAFNDAPRAMRLRAVEKLPELLDELAKEATRTAEAVSKKLEEARAFTAALGLPPKRSPKVPR